MVRLYLLAPEFYLVVQYFLRWISKLKVRCLGVFTSALVGSYKNGDYICANANVSGYYSRVFMLHLGDFLIELLLVVTCLLSGTI